MTIEEKQILNTAKQVVYQYTNLILDRDKIPLEHAIEMRMIIDENMFIENDEQEKRRDIKLLSVCHKVLSEYISAPEQEIITTQYMCFTLINN